MLAFLILQLQSTLLADLKSFYHCSTCIELTNHFSLTEIHLKDFKRSQHSGNKNFSFEINDFLLKGTIWYSRKEIPNKRVSNT